MNISSGLAGTDQPVCLVYSPVFTKEQASAAAVFFIGENINKISILYLATYFGENCGNLVYFETCTPLSDFTDSEQKP